MSNTTVTYENEDCHMGRHILKTLKKYQDDIQQIEIVSGATETHGSVRLRSIRMAEAMKARGLKFGDVVLLSAVNHNDLCIPYIASLFIGTVPLSLDVNMKHLEIKHIVSLGKPSIVFADPNVAPAIKKVLVEIGSEIEIVTFGEKPLEGYTHFSELVKETGTEESFECEDFDANKALGLLACSSGTTGLPKLVSLTHFALFFTIYLQKTNLPESSRQYGNYLGFSPLYWISGSVMILSCCLLGIKRCQSIKPFSPEDFVKAAKKYRPTATLTSQVVLCSLLKYSETHDVDFSSFRAIFNGGSSVSDDVIDRFKKLAPNAVIASAYGCTEYMAISGGMAYKKGACGKPASFIKWKIVDVDTEKELGPNQPGELRVKSINKFAGYYNNPEATAASYDSEDWYKTGDLIYYDEEGFFYVVDRIKELIKYRNFQISSTELENVITLIPGVLLAAVVGIPNHEDGQHPMAFVQLAPGAKVSAQTIKDFVKDNMSDSKQLRGGVVFLDSIPTTYSGKLNRKQLNIIKNDYKGE